VLPRKAPWIGMTGDADFADLAAAGLSPAPKRSARAKPTR